MTDRLINSLERRLAVFEKIVEQNPFELGKLESYEAAEYLGRIAELKYVIKILSSPTIMKLISGENHSVPHNQGVTND